MCRSGLRTSYSVIWQRRSGSTPRCLVSLLTCGTNVAVWAFCYIAGSFVPGDTDRLYSISTSRWFCVWGQAVSIVYILLFSLAPPSALYLAAVLDFFKPFLSTICGQYGQKVMKTRLWTKRHGGACKLFEGRYCSLDQCTLCEYNLRQVLLNVWVLIGNTIMGVFRVK